MPDDIKVWAATGDDTVSPPVATDLVGGKHYQKIKLGWGPDGTFNELDTPAGKRIPVADPVNVAATAVDLGSSAAVDAAIAAAAVGTRLMGFSAREMTGTLTGLFNIRHGITSTDPILVTVSLGASESVREWYGPDGLAAANGIWLDRVSAGAIQFTGYFKVVP